MKRKRSGRRQVTRTKLLSTFAAALLGVSIAACGSSRSANSKPQASNAPLSAASTETSTEDLTKVDRDKDNDNAPYDDTNNNGVMEYGHAAGASDRQAITALIKRYYAIATAGDGAQACTMLYITLAESVAEDQGKGSAGAPYLSQGTTCSTVMSLLFNHYHSQLALELPLLKVKHVGLIQHHGLAVLSFGKLPERQISIRRERHTWKIETLLDSSLP
jgi:hypothetical protein